MSLGRPYDRVGIVIDDNSDVLMAFPVAGLVNADVNKVIKASGTLRLNHVQRPMDTTADGLPVDSHVLGYSAARQVDSQPSDSKVEVFREAASWVGPGNICNEHAVFRTLYAVCAVLDLDQRSAPVKSSPGTWQTGLDII